MGNSHSTNVVDTKFTGKALIDLSVPTPVRQSARTPVQQHERTPVQQHARKRHPGTTSARKRYQKRVNKQNQKIANMIRNEQLKRGL